PARDQRQAMPLEDRAQHLRIAREFVAELDPLESRQTPLGEAGFERRGAAQFGQIVIAPSDRADAEADRHDLRFALLGSPSVYLRRRKISTARRRLYLIVQIMNPAATPLEISDVSVLYGANQVLDRVSLSAAGGEFIALLGASGCGKTTLLRAICGFVGLAAGSIVVGGQDVTRWSPERRNVAMVFQSYALWPHMTVAQNIGYGLKLRHIGRAEIYARIDDVLAMPRLDGLGQRKVTALSGGQRQRVALGRALAISPQVLLLDEPLSNLDARIREDVRHEIKTLQQRLGITTVHVTHDRQEAMVMADRIVILNAGHIAQIGAPEEIYNRPASPFVASF